MPKMLFRGSYIRMVDLRFNEDSARSHVRLDMSSDFSETVARDMQWNPLSFVEDLPAELQDTIATYVKGHGGATKWLELAGLTYAKLKGRIAATTIELIPNGEFKGSALSLEVNEVRNFVMRRLLDKSGNTKSLQLDFQIAVTARGAAGLLENYLDIVGQGIAQLKVGYAKQEDLDLGAATEDASDAAEDDQERLISADQAEDTKEDDPRIDGPTLAPAVLAGGTHQSKGRRDRPARDRIREAVADGTAPLEPVN